MPKIDERLKSKDNKLKRYNKKRKCRSLNDYLKIIDMTNQEHDKGYFKTTYSNNPFIRS